MTEATQAIVIMGVSGCGKSRVGQMLAVARKLRFVDADDLHPPSNIDKMAKGLSLTDADRAPWLDRVAGVLAEGNIVVACSALKRSYRDRLQVGGVRFVHLTGARDVLQARLATRKGHFMPAALLDSQLRTLEPPTLAEAVVVDIDQRPAAIVAAILAHLTDAD